jgi:uncharacterized protein YegL
MEQIAFEVESFADNPEPRVPCVLLLDVSSSMAGAPLAQLSDGLAAFKEALLTDSLAARKVETAIITFGATVDVACEFTLAEYLTLPRLTANGFTPMGEAVNRAIDMLEERKRIYKSNGIFYHRPWIFLITDGEPNDPGWQAAARRSTEGDNAKSFAFFAVGVDNANLNVLQQFTPRKPQKLKGLHFRELFLWLSRSLTSVSRSTLGAEVTLENPATPDGWAVV